MKEELTGEDILEIISEICKKSPDCGDECPIYKETGGKKCISKLFSDRDKIIQICKQWRRDCRPTKNKWTYICKIINEDSERRCVYEEKIKPDLMVERANKILKEYCKNHNGKFSVRIEQILEEKDGI